MFSAESELVWRRRSRRPQVFEKSGFACFSKTLASCIQTRLNATWYEDERGSKIVPEKSRKPEPGSGCISLMTLHRTAILILDFFEKIFPPEPIVPKKKVRYSHRIGFLSRRTMLQ
ncbi:MAG: hypothetical protein LBP38_06575, partial [Desulfovibrio sp.]|nr:hypothetical protein [Desulfovibrio sp.]